MKQKILIVDDEPDLLRLLERIISKKTDYEIITTNNSLETPRILEKNQFDVICTDFKMPGMDGMEILQMIKDQKRFEQVIMITAFGTLESAMEALSKGVFDYITKPFKKEHILFTVDRAMKFQKNARKAMAMTKIFETMPFDIALQEFKNEYIRRQNRMLKISPEDLSKKTGIHIDDIAKALKSD